MTLLGAETRTRPDYRGFHYHRERNHQGLDNQLLHRQAHRRPTARDPAAAATSANLPRKAAHTATGGARGRTRSRSPVMGPDVGRRGARRRPHGGHRSGGTRITPDRSPPRGRVRDAYLQDYQVRQCQSRSPAHGWTAHRTCWVRPMCQRVRGSAPRPGYNRVTRQDHEDEGWPHAPGLQSRARRQHGHRGDRGDHGVRHRSGRHDDDHRNADDDRRSTRSRGRRDGRLTERT